MFTGDIILTATNNKMYEHFVGDYRHVGMYLGQFNGIDMLYESYGRGVVIKNLEAHKGTNIAVFRPKINDTSCLVSTAFDIAGSDNSYYDYLAICHSCFPRWIYEKTGIKLPSKYIRDDLMICSEAVAEVFWRNGLMILPQDKIPLPSDFASSKLLEFIYTLKI